jgi:phosphoglucosamine mutase
MKRLFGTDGIRAVAGESPLDPATVRRFGAALAAVLRERAGRDVRVVLGRDTRESGPWLRDATAAGLAALGAGAVDAGVVTTPGLAHIVGASGFDAGVMISASHNPFEDNGLKVFAHDGTKLADDLERKVEDRILDAAFPTPPDGARAPEDASLAREYVTYLEGSLPAGRSLDGLRLLLDCANGAACGIAPEVFRFHGAQVDTLGTAPDGRNINLDCGSLHLDGLARAVVAGGHDLGIAFDGDADRALAVDRKGRTVDGDFILYLAARRMKRLGTLANDTVVATVMSNLWLELALKDEGLKVVRAPVGDKYVHERMLAEKAVLGGEQSGHVIFLDRASTGDGILTALRLLDCVLAEDRPLEAIVDSVTPFPQILLNVRVRQKPDLATHPVVGVAARKAEDAMGGRGRVLLRYSGTEPLARVMVEGENEALVRSLADELAALVRSELGA